MRNGCAGLLVGITIVLATVCIAVAQDEDEDEEYYAGMPKRTCAKVHEYRVHHVIHATQDKPF